MWFYIVLQIWILFHLHFFGYAMPLNWVFVHFFFLMLSCVLLILLIRNNWDVSELYKIRVLIFFGVFKFLATKQDFGLICIIFLCYILFHRFPISYFHVVRIFLWFVKFRFILYKVSLKWALRFHLFIKWHHVITA